jgi:carboxyl-terminal processing protease
MQDGYPIIGGLLPGTPAALSGQIHSGDRIIGVAQGDNRFVDAAGLSLADLVQMIRGAPGTMVQLQLVPTDAGPNTSPRTIAIVRDQIRHKQ